MVEFFMGLSSFLSSNQVILELLEVDFSLNYILIATTAVFLVLYALEAAGLYVLAKRDNSPYSYMAFVPFLNTYLLGYLAGECSFFGKKIGWAPIAYALSELALSACLAVECVAEIVLYDFYDPTLGFTGYPADLAWANNMFTIASYSEVILYIVFLVFHVLVLYSFFKKYAARNAFIFTIVCALFNVRSIFVFAVRKNAPVDYDEYMQRSREQYMRSRGYDRYDRTDRREDGYRREDDPFTEFSEKGELSDYPDNDDFFGRS